MYTCSIQEAVFDHFLKTDTKEICYHCETRKEFDVFAAWLSRLAINIDLGFVIIFDHFREQLIVEKDERKLIIYQQ